MTTLKAAGYSTGEYVGTGLGDDEEEEQLTGDGVAYSEQELVPSDDSFYHHMKVFLMMTCTPYSSFYDCEATGGSIYEIAAKVIGVPDTVNTACREFSSFSNTSQLKDKCGITVQMLYGQPSFPAVLEMFLQWINDVISCITLY